MSRELEKVAVSQAPFGHCVLIISEVLNNTTQNYEKKIY